MFAGKTAPLDRDVAFRQHVVVLYLLRHLRLEHQDAIGQFRYEIGLIFQVIRRPSLEQLELSLRGRSHLSRPRSRIASYVAQDLIEFLRPCTRHLRNHRNR